MIRVLLAITCASFLSACAIQPLSGNNLQFRGHSVLTQDQAKTLTREERISKISEQMKQVGFASQNVSYLFDKYSDTVLNIYNNQYRLMTQYRTLLDHHKDVMSFLMANQNKSPQALAQAVLEFDAGAASEQQKIGPKLREYQDASEQIWQQNAVLTGQIATQALELGTVLYALNNRDQKAREHNDKIEREKRQAAAEGKTYQEVSQKKNENNLQNFLATDLFRMLHSANRTYDAYKLAEIRLHLAKVANDFINDEQAVIEISKRLQEYQNEQ